MAEVRKGTDTRLGRVVAVKRLRTDLASDATFQARFRREAQSSASLNHPSIVAVYDTGEEQAADGSGVAQPYIVMEYVAGRTLRDILREGRKILPERALEITSGVLSALDYSHRAGIIHRDIKPGNVMLTPSGDVKVMDFGIARAISDASSTMTQTAAVVGTAQYLSPEQARGETVDSRSDVYSDRLPALRAAHRPAAVRRRQPGRGGLPARPRAGRAAVRPRHRAAAAEIDAIVMKALAKRVEDRYQSAAAMRSDIERYLAGRPVQAAGPAAAARRRRPRSSRRPTPTAVRAADPGLRRGRAAATADRCWSCLGLLLVVPDRRRRTSCSRRPVRDAPEQVHVPNVIGMTENAGPRRDRRRRARGRAGSSPEDPRPQEGKVIEQDPNRDQYVDPGSTSTSSSPRASRWSRCPS